MAGKSPEDDSTELDPSDGRKPVPVVPDHELLRCIGSGSYGEVWLARNVMGTYRAVKIVYRQTFANDRPYDREFSGIKKFEPVSRTHSGLVDILQIGRNDAAGYYYHVMELCDDVVSGQQIDPNNYVARTLGADLSNRGILPCEECLQLGLGLAAALAHLHRNGLIHRDIKPSNIIFVNGIPKIADIGLVADVGATRSFVGTEGFIPPEGPGTVQADIYSLGKVLYEASTGHDRQSFPELPTRLDEFPNQKEYLEFNEVILRACESDIHRRYRSADAMHSDLLLLRAGKSIKRLRLLEQRWGQVKRIALLATASLAVAGVVVYQVIRENRFAAERRQQQVGQNVARGNQAVDEGDLLGALPPLVEALSLESNDPQAAETHRIRIASVLEQCPRLVRMWFPAGMLNNAEFSTDGRWMVTAGKNGDAAIWVVNQDDLAPIPIDGKEELESASFSHDGRRLLTSGTNLVWLRTIGAKTPTLRLE
ncbi:MAG TPA: protein kinase, partial [Candidatus Nitrosotalea sp.]|nr:protein kinase [Candidatus Nitrosotalea sp.]